MTREPATMSPEDMRALELVRREQELGAIPGELAESTGDALALAAAISKQENLEGQVSAFDMAKLGIPPIYPKDPGERSPEDRKQEAAHIQALKK